MLKLKNVNFKIKGDNEKEVEILRDINLSIASGSFVVITGPNGSGKSTLAKIIMGIEKVSGGQIFFEGSDITDADINERAKAGIGFAFQQPVHFKGMQVRDLLSLSVGKELDFEEACTFLSKVGLCAMDYIFRELDSRLSGGEMKRIEIAMLLARRVRLSIFDEPEAGIDLWSFQNLIHVFKKLREETRGSIVVISHQERILEIADRIIVIEDGCVVQDGSRNEVFPKLMLGVEACEFYGRSVNFENGA